MGVRYSGLGSLPPGGDAPHPWKLGKLRSLYDNSEGVCSISVDNLFTNTTADIDATLLQSTQKQTTHSEESKPTISNETAVDGSWK